MRCVALPLLFFGVSLLSPASVSAADRSAPAVEAESAAAVSLPRLGAGIAQGAAYLVRNCDSDGRFAYIRHLDREVDIGRTYNLLRHAGAVYALALAEARAPDPVQRAALLRAADYLRRQIFGPVPGAPDESLALWRVPEVVGDDRDSLHQAKLGGAGLALVALTHVHALAPEAAPKRLLRGLGLFVLHMQKADGSFYSKYYAGHGPDDRWTSLYYPGEAMLGLLLLHELDPDDRWLLAAARGMGYLARTRRGQADVPPDHWALLATERLLPKLATLPAPPVTREAVLDHARQILHGMLAAQRHPPAPEALVGAFDAQGRTCPTATRMEGYLAALAFLPAETDADLRARLRRGAEDGIAFLLSTQTADGPLAGAVPRHAPAVAAAAAGRGAPLRRATEVRIDYVQHAICAMMQYEALFRSPASPPAPPTGAPHDRP